MNRVTIELDQNGEIGAICADEPIELFIVSPHTPHDRVYRYDSVRVGPQHVREQIGGCAVGHAEDGVLAGDGSHLPPSVPGLRVVGENG